MAIEYNSGNIEAADETVVSDTQGNIIGGEQTALEKFGDDVVAEQQQFEDLSSINDPSSNVTNEDRFFGARQPIQRGTSASGVPIFVANQALTPIGILDKKEAAIDEARRKKAERQAKFKLDKAQRLKNANYQKSFDEAFVGNQGKFINEAKTLYGDNWTDALGSDMTDVGRRYRQSLSNFQTLKDRADAFTDRSAEIKARIEAGDASVSEKTAQMVMDVEGAIGQFSEGKAVDLVGKMDQLNASVNIDNWLNDNIFPNLKQIEKKYLEGGFRSEDEYRQQISNHTKRIASQARGIAQRVKKPNGVFGFDKNITEDDIYDAITQRIGNYTTETGKVVSKPGKPESKDYTDEDLSNRLSKLNKVSDAFSGGAINIASEDAQAIANELVNKKYQGRIIKGSTLLKGEENKDLIDSVQSLFSYYKDTDNPGSYKRGIKKKLEDSMSKGKLVGSSYNDGDVSGTVSGIDFSEVEKDGEEYGLATLTVTTPSGEKKVEYPLTEAEGAAGFEKMRDAFKGQYPDSNDRLELNVIGARKGDKMAKKPVVLDLTDPGVKWVINDIINTAEGGTKIPTEDMQLAEKGMSSGATQVGTEVPNKKEENPVENEEKPVQDDTSRSNSFLLDFEKKAGGVSNGKAVGLSEYNDEKWSSEIQDKYLGSSEFTDQNGGKKTGLLSEERFKDSWDKMDSNTKDQLTMYSFNTSWDPRVLAMQSSGLLKPGERGSLHSDKNLVDSYWKKYKDSIDWSDSNLSQKMLNEMADIYKNTYAKGEKQEGLPNNWPSYKKRIEYIAEKQGLQSPLSKKSKEVAKKEEKPVSSESKPNVVQNGWIYKWDAEAGQYKPLRKQ